MLIQKFLLLKDYPTVTMGEHAYLKHNTDISDTISTFSQFSHIKTQY